MRFSRILFFSDFLREVITFPQAFFDFICEPIRQGCSVNASSSDTRVFYTLEDMGFQLDKFRDLAGFAGTCEEGVQQWRKLYFKIDNSALDYLFNHIEAEDLVLAFEIPPWFAEECIVRNIIFIDMRVSPLRFSRDLYIGLRASCSEFNQRISKFNVLDEELRLEASALGANLRLHQRRLETELGFEFESLDGCIVFIGQAPYDASLITLEGQSLRCNDFFEKLQELCVGKQVLHKAHPFALEFAEKERQQLEDIVGQRVVPCKLNAYQILSSCYEVELVGISSGLLEEAKWFNKIAHTLYRPFTPISSSSNYKNGTYQQIHFQTFLSPEFWHQVLAPEKAAPRLAKLASLAHHHAREALDQWWDFSKILTWERTLPYEAFIRNGGAQLKNKIADLEKKVERSSFMTVADKECEDGSLKLSLLVSLYTRLSGTYESFSDVKLKNNSPAVYKEKTLDAKYYQDLHENNNLFQGNNWLLPYVEVIRDEKYYSVREIGCGNGAFSAEIAKSVKRVVGLDWAKSPHFPEGNNIEFERKDITKANLEFFDLNCSADVLEHIAIEDLSAVIESLHCSSRFNFHVISCYDDGHSHLSILPPDAWLYLFKRMDSSYRIFDISIRHSDISHVVCVVTNI